MPISRSACALRFVRDVHRDVFSEQQFPALMAHSDHCEALAVFKEISQPFIPADSSCAEAAVIARSAATKQSSRAPAGGAK